MSYEDDLSYVYNKIFSKVTYDKNLNKYIIHKEDYLPLKLSTKQFQILKKMCKRQGIYLEEIKYRLPAVEDKKLFEEYNRINQIIISSGIPKEKHPLNSQRIAIRNQIVIDNMPLVRAIIDRNFEDIQDLPNKDEIYQLGYIMLINYIEHGKILESKRFTIHISSKLIFDIKERILNDKYGISTETNDLLKELREIQSSYSDITQFPTKKDLANKLNIEPKKASQLINIDRLLSSLSIDEEQKILGQTKESKVSDSILYDTSFEENMIKNTAKDIIIKIINTLPENQKNVLMLSYGFIDGRCYDDVEIANMFNLTKARVGIIRHTALDNLKLSIRSQYLIDYDETAKEEDLTTTDEKQLKAIEDVLICMIPKEELYEYLSRIPKLEADILKLYYGLVDGKSYQVNELPQILGVSEYVITKHKPKANISLQEEIISAHNLKIDTYKQYIEHLIETYIIHPNIKRKK